MSEPHAEIARDRANAAAMLYDEVRDDVIASPVGHPVRRLHSALGDLADAVLRQPATETAESDAETLVERDARIHAWLANVSPGDIVTVRLNNTDTLTGKVYEAPDAGGASLCVNTTVLRYGNGYPGASFEPEPTDPMRAIEPALRAMPDAFAVAIVRWLSPYFEQSTSPESAHDDDPCPYPDICRSCNPHLRRTSPGLPPAPPQPADADETGAGL